MCVALNCLVPGWLFFFVFVSLFVSFRAFFSFVCLCFIVVFYIYCVFDLVLMFICYCLCCLSLYLFVLFIP